MMKVCGVEVTKVLKFNGTPGFGKWRRYFPADAVSHPAKMNLNLLSYLIETYTREGDLVLDCMAGTGSTGVLCALSGRNCIQVELEARFYKWMEQAREKVEKEPTLTRKGKIINILGDARRLSELLKEHWNEISAVITSPPFAGTSGGKGEKSRDPINAKYPGLFERCIGGKKGALSDNPNQIDNLPYGEISTILTSPPYSLGHDSGDNASEEYKWRLEEQRKHTRAYSEGNIAKLPLGKEEIEVDTCLFSPPYDESLGNKHHSPRADKIEKEKHLPVTYTARGDGGVATRNIGNLKSDEEEYTRLHANVSFLRRSGKPTYLSEMYRVYEQCFSVLKPGGRLILVVKRFIRNFKVVKLEEHTKRLCEVIGFKHLETLAFKLPTRSFWRILYARKYKDKISKEDLESLNYEWVLVFEK